MSLELSNNKQRGRCDMFSIRARYRCFDPYLCRIQRVLGKGIGVFVVVLGLERAFSIDPIQSWRTDEEIHEKIILNIDQTSDWHKLHSQMKGDFFNE